jgi:trans-aconitate methyltransferase
VSTSLIYRSATLYEAVMLALYGRHYAARYRAVSDLIPDNATVLELCCGPGNLYRRHLRPRSIAYHGIDINPRFVNRIARLGATSQLADISTLDPLPPADHVIIQASLYHFLPNPTHIVDRMLAAARKTVIIAEPIKNLSTSGIPLVSRLARRQTDPGSGRHAHRFTADSLEQFMSPYANRIFQSFLIPGGRERIYVLASS